MSSCETAAQAIAEKRIPTAVALYSSTNAAIPVNFVMVFLLQCQGTLTAENRSKERNKEIETK